MKTDIKLGYTCNNNCIHCVIADQRQKALIFRGNQDRSTQEYINELIESKKNGCDQVVFTGGEPTLRKDLFDLLTAATNMGFRIGIQTNGRMFFYQDFCQNFKKYNIHFVIAIHGSTAQIHDKIVRVNNSFKQTIEGIKNLKKIDKTITGKVVISKINFKDLKNIAQLFKNLNVNNINFAFPHAEGNARKNFDLVVPKYSEIELYVHETAQFCKDNNIKVNFETFPFCFMKGFEELISELRFVNKKNSELKQLDGNTKNWEIVRKKIKAKFKQCNLCKHNNICEGVWKEYPEKFGNSEFKPITD
ncbi:radical SAM protein [Candidatus Woesearchaeota archaeon]|jgi:MoaA/NifB/PqqE/SkfB family radical SAM enzyme|nr:radical SAM protein [Candidatus Woesearchaeota archaeon]